MTKQQYLDNIIPVIHKACPKIVGCVRSLVSCGKIPCENKEHYKPISLEHILKAIQKETNETLFVRADGVIFQWNGFDGSTSGNHKIKSTYIEWSLGLSLSEQKIETLQFIHSILCDGK